MHLWPWVCYRCRAELCLSGLASNEVTCLLNYLVTFDAFKRYTVLSIYVHHISESEVRSIFEYPERVKRSQHVAAVFLQRIDQHGGVLAMHCGAISCLNLAQNGGITVYCKI